MRRFSAAGWVVAAAGLALGGWFLFRVRDAMHMQSTMANERAQAAKAAEAPSAKAAAPQRLVNGVPEKWRPTIALEGTLQPAREADLGFRVPGRLGAIRVKLGQRVRAGDVLATLEDTEAQAQVQAASAAVRAGE